MSNSSQTPIAEPSDPSPESSLRQQPPHPPKPADYKVYRPPSRAALALLSASLSDDDLTPTAADILAAQAQLTARKEAIVNAPLQIRSQRETEAKIKQNRWPETKIRIKFVDGTLLEKVFPSTYKIKAIYVFVRSCLREDVKPIKFILYQPPKRDLKVSDQKVRELTLAELQLAPLSILLLRFEDEALNHANVRAPLEPSILAEAVDLPVPVGTTSNNEGTSSARANSSISKAKGDSKIPKWMKLGQKK